MKANALQPSLFCPRSIQQPSKKAEERHRKPVAALAGADWTETWFDPLLGLLARLASVIELRAARRR